MMILDMIGGWFRRGIADGWNWANSLTYQEWFLLLGIVSAAGFLCMRGYGSRTDY
jgi:hypothetical protein